MAIADNGYLWHAILGLVMSMISVYYYILVVKAMYGKAVKDQKIFTMSGSMHLVALLSLIATLFIGIYPAPLATLANAAARALW